MGHAAYVVEAIKNITDFKGYNIKAQLDGATVTGEYIYVMITNSFSVAGFKIRGAKHVILDDGKFDCLMVKMPHTVDELRQVLTAFLTNDIDDTNPMFYSCKASRIEIQCEEEIPWTIDGEFGGNKKVAVIENVKKAFDIYLDSTYKEDEYQKQLLSKAVFLMEKAKSFCIDDTDSDGCRIWKRESNNSKTSVIVDFAQNNGRNFGYLPSSQNRKNLLQYECRNRTLIQVGG